MWRAISPIHCLQVKRRARANGSGCKNRHIEETALIQGIADALGVGYGMINAETIAGVERITVENQEIKVVVHEEEESA